MSLSQLFIKELKFRESIEKSRELAELVRKSYSPDLVVSIASGGILPAREISKNLNTNYNQLTIRRDIDLSKLYSSLPKVLLPFVALYQNYLFITTSPVLIEEGDFICEGLDVLIVDDTVHTGKTLQIAVENIKKRGARSIKSAAINYIRGTSPDYFLSKERIKFPWSKNSLDYEKFKLYLNDFNAGSSFGVQQ